MKILHIMPYVPVPPDFGGALRIHHLLRHLVKRHEVSVLTYGDTDGYQRFRKVFGDGIQDMHFIPNPWPIRHRRLGQLYALGTNHSFFHLLTWTEAMQRLIHRVLARETYDVILTEFALMGIFELPTRSLKVLDAHNVEYDNFRRMWINARSAIRKLHYKREYSKFFEEEMDACRRHDAMFVTSSRDRSILDKDVPNVPKYVVPNGVDTSYFIPSQMTPEPFTMVFTGMMAYVPNYDGMLYFLDEIFPRILRLIPQAKVCIVGSRPPRELVKRRSSNVIITGYVDDVRPYIWRSSVYVVPLRMGGGTRLKVLEAMAMKIPIVTTSIGCEGIDVTDGESVCIADDPQAFADRIVALFRSAELRKQLTERGYEIAREEYDWSLVGATAERLLLRMIAGGTRATPWHHETQVNATMEEMG